MKAKHYLIIAVMIIFTGFATSGTLSTILLGAGGFIFGWNIVNLIRELKE